jgi:hypothetical protein
MTIGHWFTNRGKKNILTTALDGATNLRLGLLLGNGTAGAPAAIDTETEIQDLATVTALLAIANVDEPGGSYTRQVLTSVTVTQDDTNNRANIDAANATFSAVTGASEIYGYFISRGTGVDGDDLISVGILKDGSTGTGITPNGSDITGTITDWAYAT